MDKKVEDYIRKIITKKLIEDRQKIELAVEAYGTVIQRKSDGYILSLEEMESLTTK